jgi:hypothetical protein
MKTICFVVDDGVFSWDDIGDGVAVVKMPIIPRIGEIVHLTANQIAELIDPERNIDAQMAVNSIFVSNIEYELDNDPNHIGIIIWLSDHK